LLEKGACRKRKWSKSGSLSLLWINSTIRIRTTLHLVAEVSTVDDTVASLIRKQAETVVTADARLALTYCHHTYRHTKRHFAARISLKGVDLIGLLGDIKRKLGVWGTG